MRATARDMLRQYGSRSPEYAAGSETFAANVAFAAEVSLLFLIICVSALVSKRNVPLLSLRGAKRRGNPFSYCGLAGGRIATPVCGQVRNDRKAELSRYP